MLLDCVLLRSGLICYFKVCGDLLVWVVRMSCCFDDLYFGGFVCLVCWSCLVCSCLFWMIIR